MSQSQESTYGDGASVGLVSPSKPSPDFKVLNTHRKITLKSLPVSESLTAPGGEWKLISGNSNIPLAEKVAEHLKVGLTPIKCTNFNDGECNIQILPSVRNLHVYVLQSTSPSRDGDRSINDHVMELFLLVRSVSNVRHSATEDPF
jgi:hypothetical protein